MLEWKRADAIIAADAHFGVRTHAHGRRVLNGGWAVGVGSGHWWFVVQTNPSSIQSVHQFEAQLRENRIDSHM